MWHSWVPGSWSHPKQRSRPSSGLVGFGHPRLRDAGWVSAEVSSIYHTPYILNTRGRSPPSEQLRLSSADDHLCYRVTRLQAILSKAILSWIMWCFGARSGWSLWEIRGMSAERVFHVLTSYTQTQNIHTQVKISLCEAQTVNALSKSPRDRNKSDDHLSKQCKMTQ